MTALTVNFASQALSLDLAGGRGPKGDPGSAGEGYATRAALAAVAASSGDDAYLTESGRQGKFTFAASNLSSNVTNDPLQGIYVAPASDTTGASGAWVRQDAILRPGYWGISGTDHLTALRNAFYWAARLKRPLMPDELGPYYLTGMVRVGSRDGTAPAAGAADNMQVLGRWRFITSGAGNDNQIQFENCKNVTFGSGDWDILTAASTGTGGIRLVGVSRFECGVLTKIGNEATMPSYGGSGGSVLSINSGCNDVFCEAAIVEWAGPDASAVFATDATNVNVNYQRCYGGQDGCDFSAVNGFTLGEIYVEDLGDTGSGFDCGNSSNGQVGLIHGKRVPDGMTAKTENSGNHNTGSNNIKVGRIAIDDWTGALFRHVSGATAGGANQTLHDIEIGYVEGTTTVATADTVGVVLTAGDDTSDPTHGFRLKGGRLRMNDGSPLKFDGNIIDYHIEEFDCDAPNAPTDNNTGGTTGGYWRDVKLACDINLGHKNSIFQGVRTTGACGFGEGYGNRYRNVEAKSFDFAFNTGGADEVDVLAESLVSLNANGRACKVRRVGASGVITGFRIRGLEMKDTQGTPTSTGFEVSNCTTDYCELTNAIGRNLASNGHRGFMGLHSRNRNNEFGTAAATASFSFGPAQSTMNGVIKHSSGGTFTLPDDSANPYPIGTFIRVLVTDGNTSVPAAASGVTLYGRASKTGPGKLYEIEKLDALTWAQKALDNVPLILGQSAVAVQTALGNTGEQTLATVTIPGGIMGANGQVEIEALFSYPNSANNKLVRLRFDGTMVQGSTRTTTLSSQQRVRVANRNAANSQVAQPSNIDGLGAANAAVTTMSVDTSADVAITITGQPASASEQITLESYQIVLWPKP